MADSFGMNAERIYESERNSASNIFINRAFTACSINKETFENCLVKHLKGWSLFKEAFDGQISKDSGKYRQYKKMEDKQTWLKDREKRYS